LRGLPIQLRQAHNGVSLMFVHGSPRKINEYLYEDRPLATFEHMAKLAGCDVLFFGHTHLPYEKWVGRTLFINAGSVGRPKDGDPRAGYVVLELNRYRRVEFRRVAYDVQAAAHAMRAGGLPPALAEQIETGGAPAALAPLVAPAALPPLGELSS
jgi:predicted phosphodiesterase